MASSIPWKAISANKGEITPPTILQTFFFRARGDREVVDPDDHVHLLVCHIHPFHQGANQRPLPVPIRFFSACMTLYSDVLQTPDDQSALRVEGGLIDQTLLRRFQMRDPLPEAGEARFACLLRDDPRGIPVDQPCTPLPQRPPLGFDRARLLPFRTRRRVQAAAICLRETRGVGEPSTHVAPHRSVQESRPDLGLLTDALAPKTGGIGAETSVVRLGP